MLADLSGLLSVVVDPSLVPQPNLIIWEQYRSFVEWSLDSLADLFGNAGLAVIAFTILVKTLLVPLTVQSLRSSKAMQELQPKINELRKKHGKDRQALSQATMALYQQHRINPLSGCLPMLIQIPIFFGLYRAIANLSGGGGGVWDQGFLWLDNLHTADPYKVLPILAGVFQFVQTRMMRPYRAPKITDPQQAMMNQMMTIMPITVIIFGWNFDSGPVLYWATQSIFSVVQQYFITGWGSMRDWFPSLPELPEHRRLGYRPPRSEEEIAAAAQSGGARAGVSGWMQRKMEEAQAAQRERMEQQSDRAKPGSGSAKSGAAKTPTATRTTKTTTDRGSRPSPIEQRANSRRRRSNGAKATTDTASETVETKPAASGPPPVPRRRRSSKRQPAGGEAPPT